MAGKPLGARTRNDIMRRTSRLLPALVAVAVLWAGLEPAAAEEPPGLQQQLAQENPAALGKAARQQGDPGRGAVIFYRPDLACARCHTASEDGSRLGPDLTKLGKEATDAYLVESILSPSKVIKKGFETVAIVTKAGNTVTGLLAEDRK